MSDFTVNAEPRSETGTGSSRRLRGSNKIPAVVYGGGRDNQMLTLDHDSFLHQMEEEAFSNSILKLVAGGRPEQVILREVQMHPFKPRVLHVDFQRIRASEKIHMSVPVHFVGEASAPGVKIDGGIVSHLLTEVEITCLPADLPEFLEVDVSALGLGESIHLSGMKLPQGVELLHEATGDADHSVVSILAPKVSADEDDGEEGDESGDESDED